MFLPSTRNRTGFAIFYRFNFQNRGLSSRLVCIVPNHYRYAKAVLRRLYKETNNPPGVYYIKSIKYRYREPKHKAFSVFRIK